MQHTQVTLTEAENFINKRDADKDGLDSVDLLLTTAGIQDKKFDEKSVATSSEYFQVQTRVRYQDRFSYLSSIIHRDEKTGDITLVSRDWGQKFAFPFSRDYEEKPQQDYDIDI